MRNLPIHWREGMFLRPHQFQAADRHWQELLQTSDYLDHPYNYGLRSIQISEEAIGNYQFEVSSLKARLMDGTLVVIEPGQEPDRVDLKAAFEQQSEVRVYLGVPTLKMGQPNVSAATAPGQPRFLEMSQSIQDESLGGNDQEVQLRKLNMRVLLSTQERAGYALIPIAQVKRASEAEAKPVLDDNYIPPLLACDCWPPLARDIVRAIYDILGQRIETLAQQIQSLKMALSGDGPGEADRLLMLSSLNTAYASLGCLAFAHGVHPFVIYGELCRIVGSLSIFSSERKVTDIPHYDHDDLARIFKWMMRRIRELIFKVRDLEYEQRYFVGAGQGMQVALDSKWFNPSWKWYIGVSPGNATEAEVRDLLAPGRLNWKMGSSDQVDFLFKMGGDGVRLNPLPQAPQALPAGDWIYYQVNRQSPHFQFVQASQTLGMRFKKELIRDLDKLEGQKKLMVALPDKVVVLEIAVFAVPQ